MRARCERELVVPRHVEINEYTAKAILRALTAFLLRRARQRAGLSLAQVAERLGATSINAYARYEQGRSVPTIQKLSELFAAVMPHRDLVLVESET